MDFIQKIYINRINGNLFWSHYHKWNNHFLQRNATVLVGISIITYIMIVIVGIGKKVIPFSKYEGTTHIYGWQVNFLGILGS